MYSSRQDQARYFLTIATLVYQALAVMVFLIAPFLAYRYTQVPFMGWFIDNTMITNGIAPSPAPAHWNGYLQNPDFGNKILTLDGQSVSSYEDMYAILERHVPGESIPVLIRTVAGENKELLVTLNAFGFSDILTWFVIPYIIGLIYLGVSWWIFGLRRNESAGVAFTIFSTSAAIACGALFDVYSSQGFVRIWAFSVPLVGASIFHLALVFPQESRLAHRYPFLRWSLYIVALYFAYNNNRFIYDFSNPTAYAQAWQASYGFTGLTLLFFLGSIFYRWWNSDSPIVRRQAGIILIGSAFSFGMIMVWFLSNIVFEQLNFSTFFIVPIAIFPLVTGYTVMRYRLLRTDYLISRGILYSVLSFLAVGSYVILALGMSYVFSSAAEGLMVPITVFLCVLLVWPVRARLQTWIDSAFFRGETAHQTRIQEFSHALTSAVSVDIVLRLLRENIRTSLLPSHFHIFSYDGTNDQYITTPDQTGRPTSDIRFPASSVLPRAVGRERVPLFIDETRFPTELEPERARLALLGATLFIPMPGRDRLIGWIALGEKLSGEPFQSHDLDFLDSLCSQASVALERSQIVTNMERRVQELNVLARVAQGINVTLSFDDILELIYAQSTQIVPGNDFHLTLYNKAGQYYYYAFCLEADDRLPRFENLPMPPKTSLDQEIVVARRGFFTQDFLRQCQIMNVTPFGQNIYAWIGVPLNTGAETIGALSISTRDPSIIYTQAQLDLLQAIADQAAGAIVKARLLQETQRRAQQLSTLNAITRQLTSTLELEPLLQNILDSAVNILNSEAGSLFLVDEQTGELVFRVVVSPIQNNNLVGQRLPPGTGVVGRAASTRKPVIVNEVQTYSQWNASTDKQTGFQTKSLLAIPMELKDTVIGVIEIINRKDGLQFTEDDENLLSSFAGQAAVAIENARLYTLTDQELNARVEELSVMQRIDRELNASLEVDRAMRITLEWAMRQSEADAGLIGVVEEGGVRMMAHQGYGELLARYEEAFIPLDHPALSSAIESGLPQLLSPEDSRVNRSFLLETKSQIVTPIRRESKVIGVMLLESISPEILGQETSDFLSRLSDHAAIAIANAQLYDAVQAANNAKSEFVSFVAHELKNPMTSIKGYTELLAKGAVGQVSETQANFLNTIHSNVERMSTLVSDLNDNSKIEANRLRLDFKATDVAKTVDEAVRSTKRQIEDKHQTVEAEVSAELPKVWADPTRLSQVLINLISNAYKYTPEGGSIFISAEKAANQWDPQGPAEVVHIWVKDSGIGIGPEDQKKIFQKFFRSDDSKAREAPGTGLGLNITKSLVEMQNGRIWFESEFRQGTTFHITVPISEN